MPNSEFDEWKHPLLALCPYKPGDYLIVHDVEAQGTRVSKSQFNVLITNRDVNIVTRNVILKIRFITFRSMYDEWIPFHSSRIERRIENSQVGYSSKLNATMLDVYLSILPDDQKFIAMCVNKRQQTLNHLQTVFLDLNFPTVLGRMIIEYWQC